jgi:hypothetical protein
MTSNKNDFKKRLVWVFGIVIIGLAFSIYNDHLRTLPQKYTSGTIYKVYKPPKGGPVAAFKYYIGGKEYQNSRSISGNESLAKVGSTFLVEYPVDHESSGVLLFENPVPSTEKPPYQGWSSKPSFD